MQLKIELPESLKSTKFDFKKKQTLPLMHNFKPNKILGSGYLKGRKHLKFEMDSYLVQEIAEIGIDPNALNENEYRICGIVTKREGTKILEMKVTGVSLMK